MSEPMIDLRVFFGHIEMREMPMIMVGGRLGIPYEHTTYDRAGNITDRYYTAPCAWMYYS